ncbi:unnamed protein product [Cylicocyclus nassatus]|uniref:Ground-like domain-containing protein n=1 Tax=Cylicocyclus nassatus TaxID=53992 RepID=A0AA36GHW2_CYLNA|nr:unnamed protein product [Cylicocyclus nassatus]
MFLLLAALLPVSTLAFGFGMGCGCPPPPPPPICLPPIQLPSLCPPPPPPCPCPPPVMCSPCGCGRKKRQALSPPAVAIPSDISSCNNEDLRRIILKSIESNHTEVKLHAEVRNKLGGEWVVACSSKPVTFVSQSRQYCMDGQDKTWCYAFQIN